VNRVRKHPSNNVRRLAKQLVKLRSDSDIFSSLSIRTTLISNTFCSLQKMEGNSRWMGQI